MKRLKIRTFLFFYVFNGFVYFNLNYIYWHKIIYKIFLIVLLICSIYTYILSFILDFGVFLIDEAYCGFMDFTNLFKEPTFSFINFSIVCLFFY